PGVRRPITLISAFSPVTLTFSFGPPADGFERLLAHRDFLEPAGQLGERFLDAESFEARGADKPDRVGAFVDVSGVFGRGDRPAVGEENNILAHSSRASDDALDALDRLVHRDYRSFDADAAADRRANVSDDGVGA